MKQYVHNVKLSGRDTSISLEPEFWEQFRLITMERRTTIGKLLAEIDRTHRLLPYQGPGRPRVLAMSAAVRVFVLQTLMAKLADAEARASRRRPADGRGEPSPTASPAGSGGLAGLQRVGGSGATAPASRDGKSTRLTVAVGCSKLANCWLRFTGGLPRGSTRAI